MRTGERFSPLGTESYDRIIRDASEFEEHWLTILSALVEAGLVEESDEWSGFWANAEEINPQFPR